MSDTFRSIAVVDSLGNVEQKCSTWPASGYIMMPSQRLSFRDKVINSSYSGTGFTMEYESAYAEVKFCGMDSGTFRVEIIGDKVVDVVILKDKVYRVLGYEREPEAEE